MALVVTTDTFKAAANDVLQNNPNRVESEQKKDFTAFFGTCPSACVDLWNLLDPFNNPIIDSSAQPKHMLHALVFLKISNSRKF